MLNPFSLIFGRPPAAQIERTEEKNNILKSFQGETLNKPSFLITGVRGSGKTVLMTEIAAELEKNKDWIVVDLNIEFDLINELAAKVYSNLRTWNGLHSIKINVSVFGLEAEMKDTGLHSRETELCKLLDLLVKRKKKLLITIDEVAATKNMRAFAHTYQSLIRQNYPVYLLMTGLYDNVKTLKDDDMLTFLYRMPTINLGALDINLISDCYAEIFKLDDETAMKMARRTKGYAYAFQTLGYETWEESGNFEKAMRAYRRHLERESYEKIWSELSEKDRFVAGGIAASSTGRVKEVREFLGMDRNNFNQYRIRLTDRGVLNSDTYGTVRFALPYFKQFIQNQSRIDEDI